MVVVACGRVWGICFCMLASWLALPGRAVDVLFVARRARAAVEVVKVEVLAEVVEPVVGARSEVVAVASGVVVPLRDVAVVVRGVGAARRGCCIGALLCAAALADKGSA